MKKFWHWVEWIMIGFLILWAFPRFWWRQEISYERQTEVYHQRLLDILNDPIDPNDPNFQNKRKESLKDLAKEVGAGFERFDIAAVIRYKEEDAIIKETLHNTNSLQYNKN